MEYLALLGNVNESILYIDLGNGFQIEQMGLGDFAQRCEDEFGIANVWPKIDFAWGCVHDSFYRPEYVYIIRKSLVDYPVYTGDPSDIDAHNLFWDLKHHYQDEVSGYLEEKIRKLRLIKEGSIRISVEFYYRDEDGFKELDSSSESNLSCEHRLYDLTSYEVNLANKFLADLSLVKMPKYLKFALSNFEQSYQVPYKEFEFLSLMIALEALLNDGKTELRLRVSRGCAVLLGDTFESSRQIFKSVRDLYDKRSLLVHTGDSTKVTDLDVLNMKDIVRRSLKKALELNLPKQELSSLLMESGFGTLN